MFHRHPKTVWKAKISVGESKSNSENCCDPDMTGNECGDELQPITVQGSVGKPKKGAVQHQEA